MANLEAVRPEFAVVGRLIHPVRRATCSAVLGAVAIAAALGVSGCGDETRHPAASVDIQAPITNPPTANPSGTSPDIAPLPAPDELTDVMYRLADAGVAGADKVGLVEAATADDAAALDGFGRALSDSGFTPLTFEARDLRWAGGEPGNVVASIVVKTAKPAAGEFTFPMEFSPFQGSWQLTRQTADMLLELGPEPAATPTP